MTQIECPICLSNLDTYSVQDDDGHTFCRKCILKWLKVQATCPLSRRPLTKMKMSCKYKAQGCSYSGCFSDIDKHQIRCEYLLEKCEECNSTYNSQTIKNHSCTIRAYVIKINELKDLVSTSRTDLLNNIFDYYRWLILEYFFMILYFAYAVVALTQDLKECNSKVEKKPRLDIKRMDKC